MLRELLDDARDGLLALDEHGTILQANDAAAGLLGRPKHHLLGKPFVAFVPPDERRAFGKALGETIRSKVPLSVSLHVAADEPPVVAVMRRLPYEKQARVTVLLAVEGDTPQRAAAPPAPRTVARELDMFFRRFPQAVLGVDRALRVAFANPRARAIEGLEIRLGAPFRDPGAEGRLRGLAERLATMDATLPATTIPLVDGRVLRVSGVAARGADPAVLLIEDVTEETRNERVTADFVRNAAHQLRTPLTGIASAVQVLQSGAKEDPVKRDRFLDHIERHTDRLTRVARGLLALARAQSGEPMRLDFVDIRPLFDELAAEATPADDVSIAVDCPVDLAAFCEPDLTHEAVAALLDNAVRHTHHGTIELVGREVEHRVSLEVRDTGPGILPEHRPRLFEPFYRPEETSNGFGLGLAIAAQAIKAMDGEILVTDANPGTRFTIRLPSARVIR
jgi:two-component system, OmpR family, phosphate regulon sensor histidine kinase PhoR